MKAAKLLLMLLWFFIAIPGVFAQTLKLSSYPSARATLFIDFDGQVITGSAWNWSGPIYAQPAVITTQAMNEIFNRVAEDYRPFNINVTTDSAVYLAAPFNRRVRIIVTPTNEWYGTNAGGVAYVGSFTWGDDTPGWVFSKLLGNNTKVLAEAVSHEAGHTFGLQHQSDYNSSCQRTAEYGIGSGSGEIGWAPIMGVGYYKNLTTWHYGPNIIGCNYMQNDLEIIASATNGFGYRSDDHSNNASSATNITLEGQEFLVDGIINTTGDIDAFKINISNNAGFTLNAIPENVGLANAGANVDIRIRILNSNKDTIGVYNPSTLLNAGIDTGLTAGVYYILVDGVGNANNSNYGSLGYYSMTGSLMSVLPVHQFKLNGSSSNGDHLLNWSFVADEALKNIVVETSDNGQDFQPLVTLNANVTKFNYKAIRPVTWYRLKAITIKGEREFYSNIITLRSNGRDRSVQLVSNIISNSININSDGNYPYLLMDATGKLVAKGSLQNGLNQIAVPQHVHGLLFLRLNDGQTDWTEKLLKQ